MRAFCRMIFKSLPVLALASNLVAMELVALDEADLAAVTGREGIALDFEMRVNADANGNPLASLSNCSGVGNPCTMALQFDNRLSGLGEWVVLKDYFGLLKMNGLFLDAGETPLASSPYPNPRRFLSQDGTTCLTGQGVGGASPTCTANGIPALRLTYQGTTGVFENDVEWYLNVGRVSVQYGAAGFQPANDNGNSFLGLRVTDKFQNAARIDIDGSVSLIGF